MFIGYYFQKHLERQNNPSTGKSAKTKVEVLQEDLIAIRMREATVIAELKEMKQKVMELETQVWTHVISVLQVISILHVFLCRKLS